MFYIYFYVYTMLWWNKDFHYYGRTLCYRATTIIFYVEFISKLSFSAVSTPIFSKICRKT